MDMLEGLAGEWDAIPTIRMRLRSGQPLIAEVSEKQVDIKISKYSDILEPLLKRIAVVPHRRLPGIDGLRVELGALLDLSKRTPEVQEVQKYAWMIKKTLAFVKMKCRRNEVSNDAWLVCQKFEHHERQQNAKWNGCLFVWVFFDLHLRILISRRCAQPWTHPCRHV